MKSQHPTRAIQATFLLFIFGVNGQFGGWSIGFSDTEIKPTSMNIATGKEYIANCTLTPSYSGPLNASFLYFKYPHKRPGTIERVLNSKTRQTRIPAMQKNDSGLYYCYLNATSIGGTEDTSQSMAFVSVNDPPDPITNVSCVIDNFEAMTCTWCPQENIQHLTKWQLEWSVGSVSRICDYALGSCTCRFCRTTCDGGQQNSFFQNASYVMNFTSRSDFGEVRSVAVVRTSQHIVKLRRLPHLEAESYTSRSIQLNWTQPEGFDPDRFDVIYEIQYEGQWDNELKVTLEVGNHLTHMLTNLHPYTLYNVSIRCRLDASHFWSDPLTTQVTTAEEAPSVSPTIPPGSFRIQPCSRDDDSCRNVTVFLQSVMKEYRNGVILRYRVSFHKVHHLTSLVLWVNASSLSATLTRLDARHGYISVEACNSAGRSPAAVVSITNKEDLPLPPADLVAERSETRSYIAFSWAPPSPSLAPVNNYTFFWCDRLAHSKHECQGPLHYRIIAGNVTEIDHLVTHDADVYALSANSDTGSSGMSNDWICVYDYDGLPGKPVFLFDGGVSARNVTLSWQPPSCSPRNRGRAVSYMLELWKEDSEGMVEELTLPASISSYTLTNLHPYTNYTIKMAAMAHISHGEFSVRRVSTLESTPDDPPVGLSGIMVTDHQVALSWSSPHTPNGVIKKYEVIAREDGAYLWHETVHRRNFTCDVHGGITYSFTVVAINRIGRSSEATPISISTPVRAPGQISQIQLEQFNETAATLTWSRPRPPHGPIDHYVVSCHLRDEDHNEVITCNDTRPGNETKMHMFVECNDTKVFMEVRIVAVNHNGTLPLIGRWSQRKSVEMCKNPVGGMTKTMIVGVAVGTTGILLFIGLLYYIWRCRRIGKKPLPITAPDRINSETGLMQGSHSGSVSPTSEYNPVSTVADPYMTGGTSAGSLATNYTGDHNNSSAATSQSNGSNYPMIPPDTDSVSEVDVSGSVQESEGSYAKATLCNRLHKEPAGPAAGLFHSTPTCDDLKPMAVPRTNSSGQTVDDTPPEGLTDSVEVEMSGSGTANSLMPSFFSDDHQYSMTQIPDNMVNPLEVTVYTARHEDNHNENRPANSETCL